MKTQQQLDPPLCKLVRRHLATVTAAPRSCTPPPLFCFFFLLRVRLGLRWWPR
ncbi:Mucin-associated surface protein (MASP), putative, partial [Trypanosoma cruzi]